MDVTCCKRREWTDFLIQEITAGCAQAGSGVLAEALHLYLHVTMRLYKLLLCVATSTTPLPPITLAILTKPSTTADIKSLVGKPIHSAKRPEVYLVIKDMD